MKATLTPVEWRVLELVATGITYAAVAHQMGVTEHAIKNRMSMILAKLDVSSSIGALNAVGWIVVPSAGGCGWVGACGRPARHRGQHGGFRRLTVAA